MRCSQIFSSIAFGACVFGPPLPPKIKIKVVDPQDAAIAGAQVQLLDPGNAVKGVQTTSAEGFAVFKVEASSSYHVQVLAPGFAVELASLSPGNETTAIRLHLASSAETVVVTATRTPVPRAGDCEQRDVVERRTRSKPCSPSHWAMLCGFCRRGRECGWTAGRVGIRVRRGRGLSLQQSPGRQCARE